MEPCRMGIACVSRNAFSRLPLRTVGKRRTAFCHGQSSPRITLPWTKNRSNPAGCKSIMPICRNRIFQERSLHPRLTPFGSSG